MVDNTESSSAAKGKKIEDVIMTAFSVVVCVGIAVVVIGYLVAEKKQSNVAKAIEAECTKENVARRLEYDDKAVVASPSEFDTLKQQTDDQFFTLYQACLATKGYDKTQDLPMEYFFK